MLSNPLTNQKAKKNSKNLHFFGSWGGSLMSSLEISSKKQERDPTA